jgi:hypothetical protein
MGRLEPCDRHEHAIGVATPHHSQVGEDVEEAASTRTGSVRPRESTVRRFTNEGHGAFAEAAHGLKGDGVKRVARTVMVPEEFMRLFLIPASGGTTGLLGRAMLGARGEMKETCPRM